MAANAMMESEYILLPDQDQARELNFVPRNRLESSTEFQVNKEFVVDMHQLQTEKQVSGATKDISEFQTTIVQPRTAPIASVHDIAASPPNISLENQSIEVASDSGASDMLISLPSSPLSKQSTLKKSSQISARSGTSRSANGHIAADTEPDSEIKPGSTFSYTEPQQGNEVNRSREDSKFKTVSFSAENPSGIFLQDHRDSKNEDGSTRQLLGGAQSRKRSLTSSLKNLINLRPKPRHPHKKLQRLQSTLGLDDLANNELELKASLFYHIGNPIKRWKVERVLPIKLILQLLKTVCLVVQLILFTLTVAHLRAEFFYDSREVFESLFLQNFSEQEEARDVYTAYSAQQLFSEFNFITERYFQLPDITIGGYDFASEDGNPPPIRMHLRQYARADLHATSNTFILNGTIVKTNFYISKGENATDVYLQYSRDPLFNRFVELDISFDIKNIRIVHPERAECFLLTVKIFFQSDDNSGRVLYYLRERHKKEDCNGTVLTPHNGYSLVYGLLTVLDVGVIIMCITSIALTCRSIQRAVKLGKAMGGFYRNNLNIQLSWWERRSLFPTWHAINIFSDVIIICGAFYKILLDFNVTVIESPTRVLLGTAMIVQALVILRYFAYFKQLNALTRTLYLALPELLKFLLCAIVLFLAFAITGWIILGPYHSKFFTFNDTVETLFGLLNGDDIYNTFSIIDPDDDEVAYVYSRVYLYVFLALFIYAILNLFTSLVIVAYEKSQNYDTATENEVRRFVFSGPLTPNGVALRDVTLTRKYVDPKLVKERRSTSTTPVSTSV